MKLLTKEITEKALEQYDKGSDMDEQMIIAKFFNPTASIRSPYLRYNSLTHSISCGLFAIMHSAFPIFHLQVFGQSIYHVQYQVQMAVQYFQVHL